MQIQKDRSQHNLDGVDAMFLCCRIGETDPSGQQAAGLTARQANLRSGKSLSSLNLHLPNMRPSHHQTLIRSHVTIAPFGDPARCPFYNFHVWWQVLIKPAMQSGCTSIPSTWQFQPISPSCVTAASLATLESTSEQRQTQHGSANTPRPSYGSQNAHLAMHGSCSRGRGRLCSLVRP